VRHLRSDAYSAEQVLLNKRPICGAASEMTYIVSSGALNSTHSLWWRT